MATAHEHFVKAEALVDAALLDPYGPDFGPTSVGLLLTAAQVHATLAHAAALGANERPGVPTPRSLDPRRNRQAAERRSNKKPPTAATDEGSR
jgi:hypothetical protein